MVSRWGLRNSGRKGGKSPFYKVWADRHRCRSAQASSPTTNVYEVLAAALMTDETFEKMVLMLVATPGMIAPAATATNPAINAYSIRS